MCKDGRGGGLGAKACLLNSLLSQSAGQCHILYTCAQASIAINKATQRTNHDLLLIGRWGLVAQAGAPACGPEDCRLPYRTACTLAPLKKAEGRTSPTDAISLVHRLQSFGGKL